METNRNIPITTSPEIKTPNILNLFMLGTDEHFEGSQTALTSLFNALHTSEGHSKHIINGTGGQSPNSETEHPVLGTYDFNCTYNPKTGVFTNTKKRRSKDTTARFKGLAFGYGYKDAYKEALDVIDKMVKAGKTPLRINMFGFSRGADTLLRVCNLLNVLYPNGEIEINFLAIDPVPGPGRRGAKKARKIPPIVKRYECIYSKHERRREFALQDKNSIVVENLDKTEVINHIVSGTHSHPERFISDPTSPDSKCTDAGKILWEITRRFANTCGSIVPGFIPYVTKLGNGKYKIHETETPNLEDEEYLNCYTRMINEEAEYRKLNRNFGVTDRPFVQRKRDYFIHGHAVFQDLTHLKLFQKLYPNFFDYYFQKNKKGSTKDKVREDILRLQKNELLYTYIKKCIPEVSDPYIGEPQGIPLLVEEFYHKDHKLWRLWESLQSMLFGVIGGHEKSITPVEAEKILSDVHAILIADEDKKIEKIQNKIRENIAIYANNDIAKKLITLLPGNENPLKVITYYLENRGQQEGVYDNLNFYLSDKFAEIEKIMADINSSRKSKGEKVEKLLKNLLEKVSNSVVDKENSEGNKFVVSDSDRIIDENAKFIFHSQETKDTVIQYLEKIAKNPYRFVDGAKEIFNHHITDIKAQKILVEDKEQQLTINKLLSIAELAKSYLEILDEFDSQNDTAAISHILTAVQSQILKFDSSNPLVKELDNYLFALLGANVPSENAELETVSEQLRKFDLALAGLVNPEKAIFETRLKNILKPLKEFNEPNETQADMIAKTTIDSLNDLASHLILKIPNEDIQSFLQIGLKGAIRLNNAKLIEAFAQALSKLEQDPQDFRVGAKDNSVIGERNRKFHVKIEAIVPYPLIEKTQMLIREFHQDDRNKDEDQLLTIAKHCHNALLLLSESDAENNDAFYEVLNITLKNLPNHDNDLYLILRNTQRSIPRNEKGEKPEFNAPTKKILDELDEKLNYFTIEFSFPYGHFTTTDKLIIPFDINKPDLITWDYIKQKLEEQIKRKYTEQPSVIDEYLKQLTLTSNGENVNTENAKNPLALDKNNRIQLSYKQSKNKLVRYFNSDIVKLEQSLNKKLYPNIVSDFITIARNRSKLKPSTKEELDKVIGTFPMQKCDFNLKEELDSIEKNKYKVYLYRKLDKLGKAINRMSDKQDLQDIQTKYKTLYDKLLKDIQSTTATSANYDPLPVVMDHFTNLAVPICKRNKSLSVNDMKRSMKKLDEKLAKKKPIHPGLKGVICGVIGAIVGFTAGLVVGGAITAWGGGFGALPGAIVGGVAGFTLGTAIGTGVGAGVGVSAAGVGLFQNWKNRKAYTEHDDKTKNYVAFKNSFL